MKNKPKNTKKFETFFPPVFTIRCGMVVPTSFDEIIEKLFEAETYKSAKMESKTIQP